MKTIFALALLITLPVFAASTTVPFCTTAAGVTPPCFTLTVTVPDPICPAPAPCPVCPGPLPCPVCPVCPVPPPVADTLPPSIPAGLTAIAVSPTQVNLTWAAATDNVGVASYQVYLNGNRIADTTTTSFVHTGLAPGTAYSYRVSAADAVPNYSGWTAAVAVTTPPIVIPPPVALPGKTVQTFIVYYGGGPAFVASDAPKLAKFDLIDTDRFRYNNIGLNTWAAVKALNPNSQIYLYEMGPEMYNYQDTYATVSLNTLGRYDVSRGHSMGSINGTHPEFFLLDPAGSRIYSTAYSNPTANQYSYLLDFGNPAFHAYWVEAVRADIANQPWVADGVHADNCLSLSGGGGYSAASAKYPTDAAWASAMNGFTSAITAGLHVFGQKLWCNKGSSYLAAGAAAWRALDAGPTPPDVVAEEGAFAVMFGNGATQFFPEASWKLQVDVLRDIKNSKVAMFSHTKLADGQSGTDNWGKPVTFSQTLWYALGSYLLGKNDTLGNAYFMFHGADNDYNKIVWYDEYDKIDLGRALRGYTVAVVGGVNVYSREFEKGYVYVNPTATDVASVTLPQLLQPLTRANLLSPISSILGVPSIALGGHNAAILLKPAVLVPVPPPVPAAGAPVLLYTDITSGPNSGGEGGNGTYLCAFGTGFGSDISKASMSVGGGAVARVIYLGASNGKADVQQICAQLGPLNATGPIVVSASGAASNADQSFTVRPGRITLAASAAAVNAALANPLPGDTVVVRGGTYSPNSGQIGGAFEIHNVGGTLSAPLALLAYPGERVDIVRNPGTFGTAIKSYYNAANGSQGHLAIAGFRINLGGTTASGIGISPDQTNLRIVNNEVQGMYQDGGGDAAISTSSSNVKVLGNSVHDNGGSKLYHGLYFDSRAQNPSGYDIGWNHIWNQTGGRCIQIYGDTGRLLNNIRIHDNLVHNCHLDAILLGRDTGTGIEVDRNVVYGAADPALKGPSADAGASGGCLRIGNPALVINVHHNTLADCALDGSVDSGGIRFESVSSLTLKDNIISGKPSIQTPFGTWSGNVCFPTAAPFCSLVDPLFVNPTARDYRLQPGSPAVGKGAF